jgi:hypothetical protein
MASIGFVSSAGHYATVAKRAVPSGQCARALGKRENAALDRAGLLAATPAAVSTAAITAAAITECAARVSRVVAVFIEVA